MANDDDLVTETSQEQQKLTATVGALYKLANERLSGEEQIQLRRREHVAFLERGLEHMGPGYAVLDSSRPWLCYWILHSLALLGETIAPDISSRCVDFVRRCQDPQGGYGGGPHQLPHLATTYAAVSSLVTIGGKHALESIDRPKLLDFLLRMKAKDGGFHMHEDGEIDMRGSYCAMAVAHMLNLANQELTAGVGSYVATCQTYEGGIGGEPGVEAHGGYAFCGLAAAMLADQTECLNLPRLLSWLVARQGAVEGGFQGRTNKLVDGCYSFWQGGTFLLLQRLMPQLLSQGEPLWRGARVEESVVKEKPEGRRGEEDFQEKHESETSGRQSTTNGHKEMDGSHVTCREGHNVGDQRYSASALEDHMVGDERDSDLNENGSGSLATESEIRKEVHKAMEENEHASVGSSEYETDDEDASSFLNGIRTAADLFPCEDLEALDVCTGCSRLVIEEEGEEGTPRGSEEERETLGEPLFNARALQAYILLCCQQADGGLRDKPGKSRDYYHTCYCLSGLSAAQRCHGESLEELPRGRHVLGPYSNLLEAADPVCNVHLDRYKEALAYFADRPLS